MKSNVSKLPQAKVEPVKQPPEQIEKVDDAEQVEQITQEGVEVALGVGEQLTQLKPFATVMIELPLLPIEGYVRKRVDVTFTSAEAHALKSVRNALEAKSAQLSNGKHVTSVSDAVRWIVQQIMV